MTLKFARRRADGSVYSPFETLWIATLQDGRWGIAFRSSYLGDDAAILDASGSL